MRRAPSTRIALTKLVVVNRMVAQSMKAKQTQRVLTEQLMMVAQQANDLIAGVKVGLEADEW